MTISCTDCPPAQCVIKYCSQPSISLMDRNKSVMFYKQGEYIFREGNPVYGIFIVFSGKVKVFNTGYNNKKQVVRLASAGHIFGHRALGDNYYSVSAVTLEDSVLCFIDNNSFSIVLKNEAELMYQLLLFYAEELRFAEARMKNLGQMTVREKVAEGLLIIKKAYGLEKNKAILLDVDLSRKDLAEIAGIRTDQLIRTLSDLKNELVISFHKKKIIIHKPEVLFHLISPYYPVESFQENSFYISRN